MRKATGLWILAAALISGPLLADVKSNGEIAGIVTSAEDKSALPGATVTLSGSGLIQQSISTTSGPNGAFRFQNLNPGDYKVTVTLEGFGKRDIAVSVSVGKTSNVPATLAIAKTSETVTVHGEAPLIDKSSTQLATNYTTQQIEKLPTTRSYIDLLETAPTVTDRSAYGAGGNVDGYDKFGFGAATNTYSLNGVTTNALEFGNTWVNPNYDTIAEIQLVGPGASAEYGNYTGAAVNVVTKAGTNEFHGGFSGWYTGDKFLADNAKGIADLKQPVQKYNWEGALNLGGPIVKEKLLFFASVAAYTSATAPFRDPSVDPSIASPYNNNDRQSYQLRLDYLLNNANTISGMYNRDPIDETRDGLLPGSSPEIAYSRLQNTNTAYVSWTSIWGTTTSSEVKYAGVNGHNYRVPVASLDVPAVYDYRIGLRQYNSTGFQREQTNFRHEGLANVTHYVDTYLGASHELKAGAEYEYASTKTVLQTGANAFLYIFPYSGTANYLEAFANYNVNQRTKLTRPAGYVQDNMRIGTHLTANVGLRYDKPTYSDESDGKKLLSFNNWAPRLGLSYDLRGDGKTVMHASWGRYYDKVPTYGPGYYGGNSGTEEFVYTLITSQPIDPANWQALYALIVQPQNLQASYPITSLPIASGTKNPSSDAFSASVEHQFGTSTALALSYVQKRTRDYLGLITTSNPQFTPFTFVSPLDGKTIQAYNLNPGNSIKQGEFGNTNFLNQSQKLLTLEARSHPFERLRINASFTWEHAVGNDDNNECAVLSLCTNNRDQDPNFVGNPFTSGQLSASHEWQAKFYGYYDLPFGVNLGASYRWLSGAPWGATVPSYRIAGFHDPGTSTILIEPKDARHQPSSGRLDLQLGKVFTFSGVSVTALVNVLNVTNTQYQAFDYYNNNIYATYTYQRDANGNPVSSFGKPQAFNSGRPRETRFGLRVAF